MPMLEGSTKRALDYCDSVVEKVLVNACLHGIMDDYTNFCGELSFSRFMEAGSDHRAHIYLTNGYS